MRSVQSRWNQWSDDTVQTLGDGGALIFDGLLGRETAHTAFQAILQLAELGELRPASIGRLATHRQDETIRNDLIAWLDDQADPAFDPIKQLFETVRLTINEQCWLGLKRFDTQIALYPGNGAHYERHRDAFAGQTNRRLTAIYYPNVDWIPAHGGQLRVFFTPELVEEIAPQGDRLVVFLSELLDHQVMPTFAHRTAITAWFYG
jgi:SM-20-related protein